MFCARCGQEIPDSSDLCPQCGQQARVQLVPQPAVIAPVASASCSVQSEPALVIANSKLKGVGGWLLFFCVSLTILSPLAALASVPALFTREFNPVLVFVLGLIALGAFVGANIWMVTDRAITLVKVYFIAVGATAGLAIVYVVGAATFTGEGLSVISLLSYLRMFVWIVIWAAYFHNSKRVKATFGRNL
jgi:hypothetical protein